MISLYPLGINDRGIFTLGSKLILIAAVYMLPTLPGASIDADVQALMKEAKLLPVDLEWVGKNRKRLVDRWINEVIRD